MTKEAKLRLEEDAGREQSRAASGEGLGNASDSTLQMGVGRSWVEGGAPGEGGALRMGNLACLRWKEIGPRLTTCCLCDHVIAGLGFVWTLPLVIGATKLPHLLYLPHQLDMRVKCDNTWEHSVQGEVPYAGSVRSLLLPPCPSRSIWLCAPPCLRGGPLPGGFFKNSRTGRSSPQPRSDGDRGTNTPLPCPLAGTTEVCPVWDEAWLPQWRPAAG